MACLGVHVAVGAEESRRLLSAEGPAAVRTALAEIVGRGDPAWQAASGSSWDAMHRCLSNGTLYIDEGDPPLCRTVLGGRSLYEGDDHVVAYVPADQAREIAEALAPLTQEWLRSRYDAIDPDDYDGPQGDPDFAALWEAFRKVRDLYRRAAGAARDVVFTVDP